MSFTEFFEDLSGQINNLRAARRDSLEVCQARVGEIRTDVEKLVDTFRSDHRQMAKQLNQKAKELRRKLKTDDRARVKEFQELMGEIRARIGGIFSFTHNMLRDVASDLERGGEFFRDNSVAASPRESPKESRKKKRK